MNQRLSLPIYQRAPEQIRQCCRWGSRGGRFRHGIRLLRWRPDKAPRQCTMDQVEKKRAHLFALFGEPSFRGAAEQS
jgi:hypothetical protein